MARTNTSKSLMRLILSALLLMCFLLSAFAEEWPLPGHDAGQTSSTDELFIYPLTQQWQLPLNANWMTANIAVKGKTFVATDDPEQSLLAVDVHTGSVVWHKGNLNGHNFLYVGYDDLTDRLYAATVAEVLAVNLEDGTIVKQFSIPRACDWVNGNISDGYLYLVSCSSVSKFDGNGNVIWSYTDSYLGDTGIPAIAAGKVFVGSLNHWTLQAIDANTGQLVWRAQTNGAPYTPPVIGGGLVFIGCQGQGLYSPTVLAYDPNTGQLEYGLVTGFGGTVNYPMSISNEILYFGSADQNVYAFDTRSHALLWSYTMPNDITGPIRVAGDSVFAVADGTLVALDANSGTPLWSFSPVPFGLHSGFVPYEGTLIMPLTDWFLAHGLRAFVTQNGFKLNSNRSDTLVIEPGQQDSLALKVVTTYGFTGTVAITTSTNLPQAVEVTLDRYFVTSTEMLTATVHLTSSLSLTGLIPFTITASSGEMIETLSFQVLPANARQYFPIASKP